MQEQTNWSSKVVLLYLPVKRRHQLMSRFYSRSHALSVDEHNHIPARMYYSKFVHYIRPELYRQTPHRCCCLLAAKIPRL